MTALDAPLRNVSANLIRQFGTPVVFRQRAAGVFDATADTVAVSHTDLPAKAIISDYEAREFDDLIKSGDKKLLVAAKELSSQVTTEWKVMIGDRRHKIVRVRPVYSGDLPALYEVSARGA